MPIHSLGAEAPVSANVDNMDNMTLPPVLEAVCVKCEVVQDAVSWIAQFCLPAIIAAFLLTLWWREKPRRAFVRFCMDNAKQGVAALLVHFIGVAVSEAMYTLAPEADACDWYFLFFILDSVLGLFCTIVLHHVSSKLFGMFKKVRFLSTIGKYDSDDGSPGRPYERFLRWIGQLAHYVTCSALSKSVLFTILYLFREPFAVFVAWVFSWQCTEVQKDVQLVVVLIVVPLFADAFQVATQNWWLKDRSSKYKGMEPVLAHQAEEFLLDHNVKEVDNSSSDSVSILD